MLSSTLRHGCSHIIIGWAIQNSTQGLKYSRLAGEGGSHMFIVGGTIGEISCGATVDEFHK